MKTLTRKKPPKPSLLSIAKDLRDKYVSWFDRQWVIDQLTFSTTRPVLNRSS